MPFFIEAELEKKHREELHVCVKLQVYCVFREEAQYTVNIVFYKKLNSLKSKSKSVHDN